MLVIEMQVSHKYIYRPNISHLTVTVTLYIDFYLTVCLFLNQYTFKANIILYLT